MSDLLIAVGHNADLGDMLPFVIEPQTPGMVPTRRQNAASGKVIDELPYVPFTWPLFELESDYQDILAQFGLLVATTSLVTVQVQDENYNWVLRNGKAVKPQIGTDGQRSDMFLQNFTVLVHSLRVLA